MLVFAGWEVRGDGHRQSVDQAWIAKKANKCLTNQRFRLNKMIDLKQRKPPEVTDKQWNLLVKRRATEESKIKSEKMRRVSKGKGSKAAQLASLREAAVVKLVRFIRASTVSVALC